MKLRILPAAIGDLDSGRLFYTRQGEYLGDYFLDSLSSDIDSLALHAGVHLRVFGYYRLLSRRFPFAIYYKCEGNTCTVWRVLDCRQRPDKITRTLQSGTK
jgi:plasmid stabilization system protein ParE